MQLTGRVAVVTGGGKRIGRALCLTLADAGCSVMVHYSHSADEARGTVQQITALGGQADCVGADFGDPRPAIPQVIGAAYERFGRADILINTRPFLSQARSRRPPSRTGTGNSRLISRPPPSCAASLPRGISRECQRPS